MADRSVRLLRLLGLLQRRPGWSDHELAARLEVTPRTVRRDVDRLRSLGYAVDAAPGAAGGGYRLGTGASIPPLLLDDDEATAIAIALGVTATAAAAGTQESALSALAKLDRLLPETLRAKVAALRSATVSIASSPGGVSADTLVGLAGACDARRRVRFAYRDGGGHDSERRAEPHRLVTTDRRWYLLAFDLDRGDWRTFRVDRVSELAWTAQTFVPRALDDPARFVAEAISVAPYRYQAVVDVDAPPAEVARRLPPGLAVVEASGAGTTVGFGADDLEWLAARLVELGLPFEVREPPELRGHLRALGRRLAGSGFSEECR